MKERTSKMRLATWRIIILMFAGLIAANVSSSLMAQSEEEPTEAQLDTSELAPDPAAIIERLAEEMGGRMVLAGLTEYQIDCTVTYSGGVYDWIVKQQNDNRFISQQEGAGLYLTDGKQRWQNINSGGWEESDKSTAWQSNNTFPHPVTVVRWLESTEQFEFVQSTTITNPVTEEEFQVDQIKKVNDLGSEMLYSFDKQSGLLVHYRNTPDEIQTSLGKSARNCFLKYDEFDGQLCFSDYWGEYQDSYLHIKTDTVNWEPEFPEGTFPPIPVKLEEGPDADQ